jgi:hypothetical protein
MVEYQDDGLVSEVHDEYGESVRSVATYDEEDYNIKYIDDKVEKQYSDEELESIYEDMVLESITPPHYEDLFKRMDEMKGIIRVFEEGTVVQFWPDEKDHGVFIAVDDGVDPGTETLCELIGEHYD